MKGPKPKTKEQHELSGSYDHNPNRRRDAEPDAPAGCPTMPDHDEFDDVAQAKWREICELMANMGTLSPAYATAMEQFAVAYSGWLRCLAAIREHGDTITDRTAQGGVTTKRNPQCMDLHKYHDECMKAQTELGLTPASKPRVAIEGTKTSDEDDFFEGPKIANMG